MVTISFFCEPLPRMKRDTKAVGDRSEVRVLAALVEMGYHVSIPFGENNRYDLIAENRSGRLLKVQVKTGRLRAGAIRFNACSTHAHRGGTTRSYRGEIDYFAVYCSATDQVYFIPEAEAVSHPSLRIRAPKNNMKKTIVWAERFTLPPHEQDRDDLKLWN